MRYFESILIFTVLFSIWGVFRIIPKPISKSMHINHHLNTKEKENFLSLWTKIAITVSFAGILGTVIYLYGENNTLRRELFALRNDSLHVSKPGNSSEEENIVEDLNRSNGFPPPLSPSVGRIARRDSVLFQDFSSNTDIGFGSENIEEGESQNPRLHIFVEFVLNDSISSARIMSFVNRRLRIELGKTLYNRIPAHIEVVKRPDGFRIINPNDDDDGIFLDKIK